MDVQTLFIDQTLTSLNIHFRTTNYDQSHAIREFLVNCLGGGKSIFYNYFFKEMSF